MGYLSKRMRRTALVLMSVLGMSLTALASPAATASAADDDVEVLNVSFSGSFSNGNAYTAATGETMGGQLSRRTGAESLDVESGLVVSGGQEGAGFSPTDLPVGTTTLDRALVLETEFTPKGSQQDFATLLGVGGGLYVRYQNGQLRYGYDVNLNGTWSARTGNTAVPADGTPHLLSVAYLPGGDGASMVAYLDGEQLPVLEESPGRAALTAGRVNLLGVGNDVHPAALTRGFKGSVRKVRLAAVSGEFTPSMFAYQKVGPILRTQLQVSFSGELDAGTYRVGLGEVDKGQLTVTGGEIPKPGTLRLTGPDSGLAWTASGFTPLGRRVTAETVLAPDTLSTGTPLLDLAGAVRLDRVSSDTVRVTAGTDTADLRLPPPVTQSEVSFHHLAVVSDLDANGAGTVTLSAGGQRVGEPLHVSGTTAEHPGVSFLTGASGTVYGAAVTTGGGPDDLLLGRLPCVAPTIDLDDRIALETGECAASVLSKASALRPSARQVSWQEAERTAFLHFGVNTFTDREWGHGDEDPDVFAPSDLDTDQWARTLRDNGFRYAILTVKHHDGFVLYPSRYTDHDVASSAWEDGTGDVLRSFTDSAHRYGLRVGVYLSPADWNQYRKGVFANGSAKSERTVPTLVEGDDRAGQDIPTFTFQASDYGAYFLNQLYEVLTEYGQIDEVWFDGAGGGIPDADKERYDFDAYYTLIRALAPNATIAVSGPDVRWVGNENGLARENEWSTVPVSPTGNGGQMIVSGGTGTAIGTDEALVGAAAAGARELVWWPSEVDVSIRPGWFYHSAQGPKSVQHLRDIYNSSVGRNSVLLLNIPPDRRGRLPEADVTRLAEWNAALRRDMPEDLALGATARAHGAEVPAVTDGDNRTSEVIGTDDAVTVELGSTRTVDRLVLNEDIADGGQQVRAMTVEARTADGTFETVATSGTVGYQRILPLPSPVTTDGLRIRFTSARGPVHLASVAVYGQASEPVTPRSVYHLDCGAPRAGTGTADRPLNSLGQLRGINLPPSARILVRAGTTCRGSLELWGYGTDSDPAVLGRWGQGAAPALLGSGNPQAGERLEKQGWVIEGVRLAGRAG